MYNPGPPGVHREYAAIVAHADAEGRRARALAATVRRDAKQRVADQTRVRALVTDYLAQPAIEGDRAVLPAMPLDRPVL